MRKQRRRGRIAKKRHPDPQPTERQRVKPRYSSLKSLQEAAGKLDRPLTWDEMREIDYEDAFSQGSKQSTLYIPFDPTILGELRLLAKRRSTTIEELVRRWMIERLGQPDVK